MVSLSLDLLRGAYRANLALTTLVLLNIFLQASTGGPSADAAVVPALDREASQRVHLDAGSARLTKALDLAMRDWNEADEARLALEGLSRQPRFEAARGYLQASVTVSEADTARVPCGGVLAQGCASTMGPLTVIVIGAGVCPEEGACRTLRHELGHAVGAEHQPNRGSWMFVEGR